MAAYNMMNAELAGAQAFQPFEIQITEIVLQRILERVRAFRWEAWSEPCDAGDWRYGPPKSFMRLLCEYWANDYDWRLQERSMNALPQFGTLLDGTDLHFVHERGSGNDPVPLLVAHGWPYSWHSYDGLVGQLAHPEQSGGNIDDAFSVVVPSYPGYDFSGRPPYPMGPLAIAFKFDRLMLKLGYNHYLVHGGDWGAHITSLLGFYRPKHIIGIHSTALCLREAGAEQLSGETPSDASPEEKSFVADEYAIWQREGAYSQLHATKPAKLAYAMLDSPVGAAAWIVDAFHAWSDRTAKPFEELFSFDQLLTEIMLYLVKDSFFTSTWIYGAKQFEEKTLPPGSRVEVPTALAAFRDPVFPMPPREVAQRSHNVVQYSEMPRGGHFPFYEAPDLLIEDLRAFRRLTSGVPNR